MKRSAHFPNWHRGLHALHFGALGGLIMTMVLAALLNGLLPWWLAPVHAASSLFGGGIWGAALPVYPTLAPDSALRTQSVIQDAGSASIDHQRLGAPVYVVDVTVPTVTVLPWNCDSNDQTGLAMQWQAVPVPFYAQPSAAPANRMVIYQPTTGTLWEFGQMYKNGSQWYACHGGRLQINSLSSGGFSGTDGVSASGLALAAGQVSLADLAQGIITHPVAISLPVVASGFSWPATRGAASISTEASLLGSHLQLDPSVDLNALGLTDYGRMVARAAQTYGFIVTDTADTVTIPAESSLSETLRGLPDAYAGYDLSLRNFPWDKLRMLPNDYGLTGHLPRIMSFQSDRAPLVQDQTVSLSWSATNVDYCVIPGVTGRLANTGQAVTAQLTSSTTFTLSCSGPNGSVATTIAVNVEDGPPALLPEPPTAVSLTSPVHGTPEIVGGLNDPALASQVYKVAYFERGDLLQVTTAEPFHLDTVGLADGPHQLSARLYLRSGNISTQSIAVRVQNHTDPLLLPGPLSQQTSRPSWTPLLISGFVTSLSAMVMTGWWGWHRSYRW